MNKLLIKTNSAAQTIEFAQKFASFLSKGAVLLLHGDLGAGKTHFVKGLAKGLGSKMNVTSPTFTLLNVYDDGKMPLYHFDMYRLGGKDEALEMGFDEYFDDPNCVCAVEWCERLGPEDMPPDAVSVHIEKAGDARLIRIDED